MTGEQLKSGMYVSIDAPGNHWHGARGIILQVLEYGATIALYENEIRMLIVGVESMYLKYEGRPNWETLSTGFRKGL